MPTLDYCITQALKETFKGLGEKDKSNLAKEIKQRHQDLMNEGMSSDEAQSELFKQMAEEKNRDAKFQEAHKLQMANTVHDVLNFVADANHVDDSKPLLARLAGIANRTFKWGRGFGGSTNLRMKTLAYERLGRMSTEMEQAGILKNFNDKKWRKKSGGDVLEEIRNPGGSKNPIAQKMGGVIKKYYDETLAGLHEAGLPFNDIEGFMGSYHRNPERMMQVKPTAWERSVYRAKHPFDHKEESELAYKRWKETELQHMDYDRTFKGNASNEEFIEKFMRKAYHNQVVDNPNGTPAEKDAVVFRGLAKIAARKQQIFYKSGWAFDEANKAYGYGDFGNIIHQTLEKGAHMEAFAKDWTTTPHTAWAKVKSALKERLHDKPEHLRKKLSQKLDNLDRIFDEVSGTSKIPVNATMAKKTNAVLCWEGMSSYGSSLFSVPSDLAGWSLELQRSGHSIFGSYYKPFLSYIKRLAAFPTRITKKVFTGEEYLGKDFKETGLWAKQVTGNVMSRFASADSLSGLQSKAMGLFFKMNGVHFHDEVMTTGSYQDYMRELWHYSKIPFDKLNSDYRFTLEQYGINEKEWDLIRNHSFTAPDGRKYISPDDPLNYTRKEIANYLGKKEEDLTTKEFKDGQLDIRRRMIAMFTDRTSFVFLSQDPVEQAIMRAGTRPGTWGGTLSRLLAQSHAWPVGIARRILTNVFANTLRADGVLGKMGAFRKDIPAIALYVAGIYTTSWIGRALRNAWSGKKPPSPTSPESIKHTISDIGGIYTQALFALFGKAHFGKDPIISASSPAIRNADDFFKVVSKMLHGQKFGSSLYHLIKNNTPFLNLFYIKAAFDYLIGYQIQEAISPGSIRRFLRNYQKRVRDEGAPEYFAPPTAAVGV